MQDIRLAFRSLRAAPVVTAVAVLSLALGIGANTAIFSIVDSLLLRSLPVREPARLVLVAQAGERAMSTWTNPIWEQIRDRESTIFAGATAWGDVRFDLAQGGQAAYVNGLWTSGGFFDVLGVPAILGRTFTRADDRRGGGPDGPVAVISYAFWQSRFGGAADVVGRTIALDRVAFTIVGVTPPAFTGTDGRPRVRRGGADRRRADRPWRAKPAGSPLGLVARDHRPAPTRPDARRRPRRASRRAAADSGGDDPRASAGGGHHTLPRRSDRPDAGVDGPVVPAPAVPAAPAGDHGRGGAGPADCVRQRGEPAARARDRTASRAERADRARRVAPAPGAPAPDRNAVARGARRRHRPAVRASGRRGCSSISCRAATGPSSST